MIYLKVDTLGNVLRDNRLVTSGNIYTNGGFAYTIKEDESNGYYIVTNDNIDVPNNKLIPHVFHVSSELDTVYWRTRFQHPLIMVGDNFQWINNMSLLRDSSGIVTCGSLHTLHSQNLAMDVYLNVQYKETASGLDYINPLGGIVQEPGG
ncbi:MAG: hypothetical protein IPG87_17940 [Saprospiraceae bacterium]|nr:hypothetical protein [Candidatus Vicinibacter affinis]